MAIENCFTSIKKAFDEQYGANVIPSDTIRKILVEMENIKLETGDSIAKFRKIAQERIDSLKYATEAEKVRAAENLLVKTARLNDIKKFKNPEEAIASLLTGGNQLIAGAKFDAAGYKDTLRNEYYSALHQELDRKGVLELVKTGHLEHEATLELGELYKKNGKPGVTNNKEALAIAESIKKVQDLMFVDKVGNGALTRYREGYIGNQSHDRTKIMEMGFEKWKEWVLERVDHEKTFKFVEDKDAFLEGMYKDIVDGKGDKTKTDLTSDRFITVNNYSTLAPRLEGARKLEFKDAQAFYEYNQQFGKFGLYESLIRQMDNSARDTAKLKFFGTNPEAMIKALVKQSSNELQKQIDEAGIAGDTAKVEKLQKKQRALEISATDGTIANRWAELNGLTSNPANEQGAKWAAGVRAGTSMSKLGFAYFSTIPDWMNASMLLSTKTGKNLMGSMAETFTNFMGAMVHPDDYKEFGRQLHLMITDHLGREWASIRGSDDFVPGAIATGMRYYFMLNGLSSQSIKARISVGMSFARELGSNAHLSFNDLNPRLKANIEAYGIGAREWSVLQKAVGDIGGNKAIITEKILQIPKEEVAILTDIKNLERSNKSNLVLENKKLSPEMILRDVAAKYSNMLNEQGDLTTLHSSSSVRARAIQGTRPGTVKGEAFRFGTQFKTPSLAAYDLMSQIYMSDPMRQAEGITDIGRGKGDMKAIASFIMGATALSMLAQTARNYVAGKPPPDPMDKTAWFEAFVKSGAAGLYGDLLLSPGVAKPNRSLGADIAGPTVSTASDIIKVTHQALQGEKKAARGAFEVFANNNPLTNIFWFKRGFDSLLLDPTREYFSPGYTYRRTKKYEKEKNK